MTKLDNGCISYVISYMKMKDVMNIIFVNKAIQRIVLNCKERIILDDTIDEKRINKIFPLLQVISIGKEVSTSLSCLLNIECDSTTISSIYSIKERAIQMKLSLFSDTTIQFPSFHDFTVLSRLEVHCTFELFNELIREWSRFSSKSLDKLVFYLTSCQYQCFNCIVRTKHNVISFLKKCKSNGIKVIIHLNDNSLMKELITIHNIFTLVTLCIDKEHEGLDKRVIVF